MNNVWGRGGLFEQALASKLSNQDAETDLKSSQVGVDAMNADTKRMAVNNQYDLGLRDNRVNQMTADTQRFGAETTRAEAQAGWNRLIDKDAASSLGLRTFNPVEKQPASLLSSGGFAGSAVTPATTATSATQPASTSTTSIFRSGNSFSDKPFGMKNGGLVMKPKMVQPGYMHGGKITPPKGYKKSGMVGCAKGGKIGDVKDDTGKDTINAKVRPGEYMLNPETVKHIGGGDYAAGVRNLNQIVREATGKEPGPTPVGKSGKAGYGWSGVVDDYGNMLPGREVPVMDNYGNLQAQSWDRGMPPGQSRPIGDRDAFRASEGPNPRVGPGRPSPEATAYNNARMAREAASTSPRGGGIGARFAQGADDVLNMNVGDAARKGARVVRGAAEAVKDATVAAMNNPVARVVGKAVQPLVLMDQAHETYKTPTDEMYRRYGFDENDSSFMHDVGVRALDFLQGVGNTATFGVADRLGNLMAGNGFVRSPRYRDSVTETVADPTNGKMPPPPKENADKSDADKAAAAQPSLRDIYMQRIMANDMNPSFAGNKLRAEENRQLLQELSAMDRSDTAARATSAKAVSDQRNKNSDDLEKMIKERYTKKFVDDKTGEVKESYNQAEANEFRRHVVDQVTKATMDPNSPFFKMDVRDINPYQLMASSPDFQTQQGVRNMLNSEIGRMKDGRISSEMVQPHEIVGTDELSLGTDVGPLTGAESSAGFLRDYVPSLFKGGDYDKVVIVNRGGKQHRIPMTQFTRLPDGSVNEDVMNQYPSLREFAKSK